MSLFVRPPPSIGADDFEEEVLGKLRVGPPVAGAAHVVVVR